MKIISRKNPINKKYSTIKIAETKEEAILNGLDHYNTGKLCKNGHISTRNLSGSCKECNNTKKSTKILREKGHNENYWASLY